MYFKFWGTRGSVPVPGKSTLRYGGNTPCVEIRSDSNVLLILDAGTGIRELGKRISINGSNINPPRRINVFISHYHWDHIQGLPFFSPLYEKSSRITFYGTNVEGQKVEDHLKNQMGSKYFPFPIEKVNAEVSYKSILPNETYDLEDLKIETLLVNHSSPTLTFKITENGKCLVYMTDNEIDFAPDKNISRENLLNTKNRELIDFCLGCDYLIHDTMYDEKSSHLKKGWGHSGNVSLAYFSIIAKIKNLILFHYNPEYSDDKIDILLNETREILRKENSKVNCIAAKEGLEIKL